MNAEELRSVQAPLKERYREDPEAALITLRAQGRIGEGVSCKIETGKAAVVAGLHPATGGKRSSGLLGRYAPRSAGGLRRRDAQCGRHRARHRAAGCLAQGRRRSRLPRHAGRIKGGSGGLPEHTTAVHARHRRVGRTACHAFAPDREVLRRLPDRSRIHPRWRSSASPPQPEPVGWATCCPRGNRPCPS